MNSARRLANCGLVAASMVFVLALSVVLAGSLEKPNLRVGLPGSTAESFRLPDLKGSIVSSSSLRGSVSVVCFAGEPPLSGPGRAADVARLAELARQYQATGSGADVKLLAIYSNSDDLSSDQMRAIREDATDAGSGCTTLLDPTGRVANHYRVDQTPTFFVIDPNGTIRYRGGIDDPSADAPLASTSFNRLIDLLLAERPLPAGPTPAVLSNINK